MSPTPLNIKDFVYAIKDKKEIQEILDEIEKKSKQAAQVFANDIKAMEQNGELDRVFFLLLLFIFKRSFYGFKARYEELLVEFDIDIKSDEWIFERVRDYFQDDKIDTKDRNIEFSHPSYSEALPYLLIKNNIPTEFNTRFFSRVLDNLADYVFGGDMSWSERRYEAPI